MGTGVHPPMSHCLAGLEVEVKEGFVSSKLEPHPDNPCRPFCSGSEGTFRWENIGVGECSRSFLNHPVFALTPVVGMLEGMKITFFKKRRNTVEKRGDDAQFCPRLNMHHNFAHLVSLGISDKLVFLLLWTLQQRSWSDT